MSDNTVTSAAAPVEANSAGVPELLRHTLATLAYRASKAVRDAPAHFADYQIGPTTRTPIRIVAHMGDLMDWALTMVQGRSQWRDSEPQSWDGEADRFFEALSRVDSYLAQAESLDVGIVEKLFQGPIADALTHTGQLTLLRRLAGAPVRGESYARAEIVTGRTTRAQAPSRWEFD
jgi:hypothetical protein